MPPHPPNRYALHGRVVTMDDDFRLFDPGIVYVDGGRIQAVQAAAAPAPAGFANVAPIRTRGTVYPGLIELHNHLSYNALPLWAVPMRFSNRSKWGGRPDYRKLVSGPMQVLGRTPGCVEAVVRYVECKCLLGGVTTSQGIALFSNQGIQQYYRGIVRNVEATDDANLPEASSRIADIEARDATKFLARLNRAAGASMLLHLSEGVDEAARKHFRALQMESGEWAITPALAGIHCTGLKPADFQVMGERGGAMVWSPLSNLLLYGGTSDVRAAKAAGLLISAGSDWSTTGSKNLLGELKVARLVSQSLGDVFTDREIVAMATRNPARILKWQSQLGSLETGKQADLLVVAGRTGDPYEHLLTNREDNISLVVIGGVARAGTESLMTKLGGGTEKWRVGQAKRLLNLDHDVSHPSVGALTLAVAAERLEDHMRRLPELAAQLEDPLNGLVQAAFDPFGEPRWFLVLDHSELSGVTQRPHLPFGASGAATGDLTVSAAAEPLSQILEPVALDRLTVADDDSFLENIVHEQNLPDFVKVGLPDLF